MPCAPGLPPKAGTGTWALLPAAQGPGFCGAASPDLEVQGAVLDSARWRSLPGACPGAGPPPSPLQGTGPQDQRGLLPPAPPPGAQQRQWPLPPSEDLCPEILEQQDLLQNVPLPAGQCQPLPRGHQHREVLAQPSKQRGCPRCLSCCPYCDCVLTFCCRLHSERRVGHRLCPRCPHGRRWGHTPGHGDWGLLLLGGLGKRRGRESEEEVTLGCQGNRGPMRATRS